MLDLPKFEFPEREPFHLDYNDSIFSEMANDIKSSQNETNAKLDEMNKSSIVDRKINIAILVITAIGTICSIVTLIFTFCS